MGFNGPNVVTMDKRACPLMSRMLVPVPGKARRQSLPDLVPCIGAECALWMRYERDDGQIFEACCFVLNTILQEQTIKEQIRVQASVDKVATEVACSGVRAIGEAVHSLGEAARSRRIPAALPKLPRNHA